MVDIDARKGGVDSTASADVHGVIEEMRTDGRDDVGVVDTDDVVIIDDEVVLSGEHVEGRPDLGLTMEVLQPGERDGLWLQSVELCEMVVLAGGIVLIEGDVNVGLIVGVSSDEVFWNISDVEGMIVGILVMTGTIMINWVRGVKRVLIDGERVMRGLWSVQGDGRMVTELKMNDEEGEAGQEGPYGGGEAKAESEGGMI